MKRTLKYIIIIIFTITGLLHCLLLKSFVPLEIDFHNKSNDDTVWSVKISGSGGKDNLSSIPGFDYELFINDNLINQYFDYLENDINHVLYKYYFETAGNDRVELVLLNHHFKALKIVFNGNEYIEQKNEIPLIFSGNQRQTYSIEILPVMELRFIYIEISGGMKNIRFLNEYIDDIIKKEEEFIIYYNGPTGAMIINDTINLSSLYNVLYTSITQPPFPSDELRKVNNAITAILPENVRNLNLNISFFISEISYNRLAQRFIEPLLAGLKSDMGVRVSEVTIYTDFTVSAMNPEYNYKNIAK